jgi:lipopolysaccharide biosynthesis glycosyltransferase
MRGDEYLSGIIASVHSVRRFKPKADLVVMFTSDVSKEAQSKIKSVATHITCVEYIKFVNKFRMDLKARKKYDSWMDVSYTKWNCLSLPYKKIFLLDADVIAVKPLDHIFEMKTPASIFYQINPRRDEHVGKKDKNGYLMEGAEIPPSVITKLLNHKFYYLAAASSILLEPGKEKLDKFIKAINDLPNGKFQSGVGGDEQAISYFEGIVLNQTWYNLPIKWNSVVWMDYHSDDPLIVHFMAKDKPWNVDPKLFDDLPMWYRVFKDACNNYHIDLNLKYSL